MRGRGNLIQSIKSNLKGSIIASGVFNGDAFIETDTLFNYNPASQDIFVLKIDTGGNYVWSKSFGGFGYDFENVVNTDTVGNIYLTGTTSSRIFYADTFSVINIDTVNRTNDLFIVRLDANGTVWWLKSFHGNRNETLPVIEVFENGDLLVGGNFSSDSLIYDYSTIFNNDLPNYNYFLSRIDNSGNLIWSLPYRSYITAVKISNHNLYLIGKVTTNNFMLGQWTVSNAIQNIFVAKSDLITFVSSNENTGGSILAYPNPTTGMITLQFSEIPEKVLLYSNTGELLTSITGNTKLITTHLSSAGLYVIRALIGKFWYSKKIIMQN